MEQFPHFRGLTYPVGKTTEYQTVTQTAVSGKEVRFGAAAIPRLRFSLKFSFLKREDMKQLISFYHTVHGDRDAFLFVDKSDCYANDELIGIGDGATDSFQLMRNFAGVPLLIKAPHQIENIRLDGMPVSYTHDSTGGIQLGFVPPEGSRITASFSFSYIVRFADELAIEQLNSEFWCLSNIELLSVK